MKAQKTPTGTREWAKHNYNVCRGCSNNCRYCYAREMALRFKQIATPEDWKKEVVIEKKVAKRWAKKEGTIMFPTTHDITTDNFYACLVTLRKMLSAGNKVLIVTKPTLSVIKELCDALSEFKSQILFRFTIGNLTPGITKYWEKDASEPWERYECLKKAYEYGFQTSVSCEPMLCGYGEMLDMVKGLTPFITDALWIGKMNDIKRRVKIITEEDREQVARLQMYYRNHSIMLLYHKLKDNPKIKWKDSIKKVVGIEAPEESGLDI